MRLHGSDPDVETLIRRIKTGDYDLNPDFQRGEVWSDVKKRRLIDTILREWHVPPIHVIDVTDAKVEVLDGQQRLAAIRDFAKGQIVIDGYIEPINEEIRKLHGLKYAELPPAVKRKFDRYQIRVFLVTDYEPSEPGELFFRLNQPTNLTAAEQRNAFFGPARQQVKDLVEMFKQVGLTEQVLGFSNSRMSYDDVVAKLFLSMDKGTLLEQVTAANVTNKYRSKEPFDPDAFKRAQEAIKLLGQSSHSIVPRVKFNKTTLYSWLCFIVEVLHPAAFDLKPAELGEFISLFERRRSDARNFGNADPTAYLLGMFTDRASSRVSDVSSVLIRDVVLWIFFSEFVRSKGHRLSLSNPRSALLQRIGYQVEFHSDAEAQPMINAILSAGWGSTL